jgi:hypothetical protein
VQVLDLTLNDGRKLSTSSVYIEATDAGLLEGYPFAAVNDEKRRPSQTPSRRDLRIANSGGEPSK